MKTATKSSAVPLAERMRPERLEDFCGQHRLVGEGKVLRQLLAAQSIPSLILWGPPGSGKTSLARIIAGASGADFVFFSAVLAGVKEVRAIVRQAEQRRAEHGARTVLFVDEIHRFNKSQQDGFLPHVESGLLTLIGATTENPSFQVIAPLLSRCRVLVLEPLAEEDLRRIFRRALSDEKDGLGAAGITMSDDAVRQLVQYSDGDARRGLNILEVAATLVSSRPGAGGGTPVVEKSDIVEAGQERTLRYDRDGEEHYNLISALHKSMRDSDPDGSLYWFYRMIEAGEDPLYIGRRLLRFASEDIGLADPNALVQAIAGREAYHLLGSPEGELALAQAVIYLATAPKSNSVYKAAGKVRKTIGTSGSLPVPLALRNAPTGLMKELGYGNGYRYAHDDADGIVAQDHLPERIGRQRFYLPANRGYEAVVKERLEKWRDILEKKKR